MAVVSTFYVASVAWNSITWSSSTGGTLECSYEHEGQPLMGWTGDDQYNTFLAIVDKVCRITVRLRDVKVTSTPGTSSSLVMTLKTKSSTSVLTFPGMVLASVGGRQGRATLGESELVFVHESADGTTTPLS